MGMPSFDITEVHDHDEPGAHALVAIIRKITLRSGLCKSNRVPAHSPVADFPILGHIPG